MREREIEMFGEVLNDEDLEAELALLEAEDAAGQLGEVGPVGAISATDAEKYRQEHGIVAPAQEQA